MEEGYKKYIIDGNRQIEKEKMQTKEDLRGRNYGDYEQNKSDSRRCIDRQDWTIYRRRRHQL